jgi:signal transduction histidine kinase
MSGTTTAASPPAEERLVAEYHRLVELNQSKDRFLHTVSHELRTPLTSILSCTELLADERTGDLSADQREFVQIVERSAGRLLRLVDDLLELALMEAGRLPLRRRLVDVADVVADAARARRATLAASALSLTVDVQPGPPADVDPERIGQVVDNLLSNAEKFTQAGGRVRVSAVPSGRYWQISVADNGMGIPAVDQRTVFEEFTRASNARGSGTPGTGLGLAISRTIAEKHGGDLELTSREGEDTTVTLRLPYAYAPVRPPP